MVFQIWSATDKSFCHFGPFFALLLPPNNLENQNFEKVKKSPAAINILHKRTKNHDHMLYCSLDMVCDRRNYFSFLAIFALLPPTVQKRKIKKNIYEKTAWRYHFT